MTRAERLGRIRTALADARGALVLLGRAAHVAVTSLAEVGADELRKVTRWRPPC